jgi:hypothetical protein
MSWRIRGASRQVEWLQRLQRLPQEWTRLIGYIRRDVHFGSLHMQQLHAFDELRIDQGIIRFRSAKIDTWNNCRFTSFVRIIFDFRSISSTSQKIFERIENGKNLVFLSFRWMSKRTSQISTSAIRGNNSHEKCMSASLDIFSEQVPRNGNTGVIV